MEARCLASLFILFLVLAPLHARAAALSEGEALELGLESEALRDTTDGVLGQARAEQERARRWPNPVLSYQREQTSGQDDITEDYAWLSQTVDIAGRRSTRGRAADERFQAAHAEGEALRQSRRAEIQERFFEALLSEQRTEALRSWLSSGTRIARIIERREKAGEVSAYDRRRLEREQASASARVAVEHAASMRARERLRALIGDSTPTGTPWTVLSGNVLPERKLPSLTDLLHAVEARPDLEALRAEQRAATLDSRAAGRWWLPDLTLGAGVKTVEVDAERLTGPFLTVSVPLPVLDQSQADALEASARGLLARGRYALAHEAALADVRGLWGEASALVHAAKSFRQEAISWR
jgi:cobalt-zinc-cadmium efflux system outer membrane protein